MAADTPAPEVIDRLTALFRRNGYVRRQSPARRAADGYRTYKKGDEVRLVAESASELQDIRRLLREAGFAPGRPFQKAGQWRQPVYGRESVTRFLALVGGEIVRPPRRRTVRPVGPTRGSRAEAVAGTPRPVAGSAGRVWAVWKLRTGHAPLTADEWAEVPPAHRAAAAEVRPRTLAQVGAIFGLTRERVRQILARAARPPATSGGPPRCASAAAGTPPSTRYG